MLGLNHYVKKYSKFQLYLYSYLNDLNTLNTSNLNTLDNFKQLFSVSK